MPSQPSRYQTFLQVPIGLGKERGRPRLPEAATLDPLPQLIPLVPKNRYIVSNHWNKPQIILWAPRMEYRDIGTSNLFSWCSIHSMVTRAAPWAAGADSISPCVKAQLSPGKTVLKGPPSSGEGVPPWEHPIPWGSGEEQAAPPGFQNWLFLFLQGLVWLSSSPSRLWRYPSLSPLLFSSPFSSLGQVPVAKTHRL